VIEGASDILIIGAGPTGCAAGIVLRRAGFDVCVVDAAQFPRDKVCGDALSNDAVRAVKLLGASDAIERGGYALVKRAAAVFPDGTRIERGYDEAGYIVPRRHLDDCLRRTLESAGARVIQGQRVLELVRTGAAVTGATGAQLRWSAKLVIAADGYSSVGWKALGIAAPRGRQVAVSTTAYYRNVTYPNGPDVSDHLFEDELPCGYSWIFPAVDGVSNVGVYIRGDTYAAAGARLPALMEGFIARHPERFAHAERVGELRSWPLPLAPRALPLASPGLLLAGDAAGFIDPLSGEGIWQALYSGMLAAEIAGDALRAGRLTATLSRRYNRACARVIARPSQRKAWVQDLLNVIMQRGLYRNRGVRAMLRWGYERHLLETTKH
jgi:geranylgeranyl reductase family protein